jgi:hypothetical protein
MGGLRDEVILILGDTLEANSDGSIFGIADAADRILELVEREIDALKDAYWHEANET